MTTTPERIKLDDLTSDQLDALYDRIDTLTAVCQSNKRAYVGALEHANEVEAATDAVYRERAHLVAHLAALHPSHIGHTDPAAPEYAVLTVETPAGQMTWHIAERDMDLFAHVRATADTDPVWDGHTTDEKYARLRDLTEGLPNLLSDAEVTVTRVRRLLDRGPIGTCCDYLLRAALTPPRA
ncbi:hypothetical protein [Streptomyces sp. NPDC060184]|uniref:WDGH domain-containing protein n=1 Tax=Streptomyces sp. NPDC060184 TaxID=3347064 RepID=UPI0036664F94